MAKKRKRETSEKRKKASAGTLVTSSTDFSGLDRINAIPDFTSKLAGNFLENTILKYSLMKREVLVEMSTDPDLTVLEVQVIVQLVESMTKGKGAAQARAMTQDRVSGKATNKVEHSGPAGAPISISNSKLVDNLGDMSKKELLKIKEAVLLVKSVNDAKNEAKEE